MRRLLDPKLDLVFKLLFVRGPESLLRALLTAVLRPKSPIKHVTVQNPELRASRSPTRRSSWTSSQSSTMERDSTWRCKRRSTRPSETALYYWARTFGRQLERGGDYGELKPVISILFVDYLEIGAGRLHSIFELLEVHDHARFSDALAVHLIELPQLHEMQQSERVEEDSLVKWSRFLAATTDEEIEELAMSDSDIGAAKDVLEHLSADPRTRELAEEREIAIKFYQMNLKASRKEGIEEGLREGKVEGLREGKVEGLREAISDICEAFGIELDARRRAHIEGLDLEGLNALRRELKVSRTWPSDE